MTDPATSGLRYDVSDRPPHGLAAALAAQVVVLILAGIVLIPVIVLKAAGAAPDVMSWAIFAALLVSGLTTILQSRPIGPFGAGYVLFMGTSGAFIAVSTTAVRDGGLPLLATLVVISSLIQFAFSSRLSLLRRIITPTVGGTVIMLIAVNIFPICFHRLAMLPPHIDPASGAGPATAGATFVSIVAVSLLASGQLRLWGPLIGVLAGSAVAAAYGVVDLEGVRNAAWVGVPETGWPGLDLSFDAAFWALLPAFLIVTIVGAIETFGDGIAIQRVSQRTREPVDFKAVQGAVNADGVGNLLSGLAGTLPNTTYATSISVAQLTGVAARRVGVYGGIFTACIAFLPKLSALIQAIPDAVVGAYILVLLVLLFAQGLRLATSEGLSYENGLIVCLAFWLGLAFQSQLVYPEHLPEWAHTLLDNGMTAGTLVALTLTGILSVKNRTRDEIELAPTPAAIPELHAFLGALGRKHGWDRAATDRLLLAGEESLLFLIRKEEEASRDEPAPIPLRARAADGVLELEFRSGPRGENVEQRVRELSSEETVEPEDAGLRILGHLARSIRHEQFYDCNYLLVSIDSKPLRRRPSCRGCGERRSSDSASESRPPPRRSGWDSSRPCSAAWGRGRPSSRGRCRGTRRSAWCSASWRRRCSGCGPGASGTRWGWACSSTPSSAPSRSIRRSSLPRSSSRPWSPRC